VADDLILSGQAPAIIIVFPDDRSWNLKAGPSFGNRLVQDLIPHIDETYRTRADRVHRAMGGLSRGGGWTVHLGLQYWEMFGALGLHSPAVAKEDAPYLSRWISEIPSKSLPRIWLDIGDRDTGLSNALRFEDILTYYSVPHEWHQYAGDHTENYWGAHVEEYLRWYTQGWLVEGQTPLSEAE
jgi:enterochelin esterase-like enzyme